MKIHKWGNSLGVRLPKALAEQAGIGEGTEIDIVLDGDRIVVQRARPLRYELHEMVSLIKESNIHDEIETGDPEGGEAW
jgi:antitoxin MazE